MPDFVNAKKSLYSKINCRSRSLIRQPVKTQRGFRSREPSRISLREMLKSLKNKKLRKKHKNTLKNLTLVSSTVHSIASNYKWWNIRYIHQQDSFYSRYFKKIKLNKSCAIVFNISKRNIVLSGDVELNPGPVTNNASSLALHSNTSADFLLN